MDKDKTIILQPPPKCLKCGKTIRRWGINKDKDWSSRKYHKKCWLEF